MKDMQGIVREYHEDEGWGVIDGGEVPGGCWVHFSAIEAPGYRTLDPGEQVTFTATRVVDQDGFRFRADRVWRGSSAADSRPGGRSGA